MSANQEIQEPNLAVDEALKILRSYGCIQHQKIESKEEHQKICQALKLITELSEYQNFGVCADNAQEGFKSLQSYLKALGYQANLPSISEQDNSQPVYIKFSGKTMSHYIDGYPGDYRGVLVSCYSDEQEEICGTYGHFPLNLFD